MSLEAQLVYNDSPSVKAKDKTVPHSSNSPAESVRINTSKSFSALSKMLFKLICGSEFGVWFGECGGFDIAPAPWRRMKEGHLLTFEGGAGINIQLAYQPILVIPHPLQIRNPPSLPFFLPPNACEARLTSLYPLDFSPRVLSLSVC